MREEERTEQETEQTKEDIIIRKLDKIQVQNGIIMSAIGSIMFIMLDKRKELGLDVIHTSTLDDCLTSIVLELGSIQKDTETETEKELNRQNDEVAKEIVGAIVGLFK